MNTKLDSLFKFRDGEKFKKFVKVFTVLVLLYTLVILGLTCWASIGTNFLNKPFTLHKAFPFSVIPLLLVLSFFKKNDYLFLLAEAITVVADIFLMVIGNRPVGFPIYIFVQLTYALYFYIRDPNKKRQLVTLILRVVLSGIAILTLFFVKKSLFNPTNVFGVIYFMNILLNVVCAIYVKDPILIIGFTIFMISDAFIALGILVPKASTAKKILNKFNFVHFFYLISQPILVFNRVKNNYNCKKEKAEHKKAKVAKKAK